MLQLNVDAAIFATSGRMGVGAVLRDQMGVCIAGIGDSSPSVSNHELAETMVIRLALSWAKDEGLDGFIVASDCLSVLQRIKADKSDRSSCGLIIHDIKKLSVIFSSCYFRHVGREQNFVAHNLARSCEFASMSVWRGMPPEYIRVAICNDPISG
jgi:ribonuclease HI